MSRAVNLRRLPTAPLLTWSSFFRELFGSYDPPFGTLKIVTTTFH